MTVQDGIAVGVRRRRRRRRLLAAAVSVAVLGTTGVVVFTRLTTMPRVAATQPAPEPATVEVIRRDLVDLVRVDGTLGYGPATAVNARRTGTLTWLPAVGTVINCGEPLYAVDAVGVPVLFGSTPMYRELAEGVSDGPDIKLLQENLVKLGYFKGGVPDGDFGAATTQAVKRWQKARKVEETGRLALGEVVVLDSAVRVDSVTAQRGALAEGEILKVSSVERLVTVKLEEVQAGYAAVGAKVTVELPGARTVGGTVRAVANKQAEENTEKAAKLVATIGLDDPGAAPDTGTVTVALTAQRHAGVLAVPVRALLALREGGYGLEVVDSGQRRLMAVQVGMFGDGMVEVSGDGVVEGMRVVVPE
ncbi:peptidoglycan hydrolase-like protein with peptidoglycan-binding domain [Kibdelosporangium banguiense]|uniref:Peptidoglycan hydrolase-like protein with peptidoglycan-binding domain n=1 Tax=Kibdelosporangium banguiense TaxID=1365924 RepID=A0ABS4T8J2_9PSEU|nr:peptidoglycan-binding protein [Kibdelosporangium banguiense]MBP2320746.1 peptidoglycan hydrolase-like protein with peptidoglycan-binding domain [Kibdelosporangium banguiense]